MGGQETRSVRRGCSVVMETPPSRRLDARPTNMAAMFRLFWGYFRRTQSLLTNIKLNKVCQSLIWLLIVNSRRSTDVHVYS